MAEGRTRPAWAEIDLDAVRHNAALLAAVVAPARLCAVVKADGYGHGAPAVARAALAGGASWLAVALVDEGVELRQAGIDAPVLLLAEPPPDAAEAVVEAALTPTAAERGTIERLAAAGRRAGRTVQVHLKVDTGMHRLGADPADAATLAGVIAEEAALELHGLWTHLAVADGGSAVDRAFTEHQLDRFDEVRRDLAALGRRPALTHAANTAAAVVAERARYDLVRCGIGLYGALPSPAVAERLAELAGGATLRPALSLKAHVTAVRRLPAGARPSYGRLRPLPAESVVATVPLGYADGVPRRLFASDFSVLVGGRRCPLAGMVTMDQILVDCGPDATVEPGDEVVLLGRQGAESVDADEWARCLGTINYEVLTGIGSRVPRRVVAADRSAASGATVGESSA